MCSEILTFSNTQPALTHVFVGAERLVDSSLHSLTERRALGVYGVASYLHAQLFELGVKFIQVYK